EQLLALADDKPIALGEVGSMPTPGILRSQPRWAWFMLWGDPSCLRREREAFRANYESEETLTLEDLPWAKGTPPKIHHPILK
ncbi:MAG: glycosyl hydrolase family 26, partial [Anaerolineae bacterium]|nr:glycosyl hydrolase family 26 [Anaerolineae bacterium]